MLVYFCIKRDARYTTLKWLKVVFTCTLIGRKRRKKVKKIPCNDIKRYFEKYELNVHEYVGREVKISAPCTLISIVFIFI